jgi:hypothetical protein
MAVILFCFLKNAFDFLEIKRQNRINFIIVRISPWADLLSWQRRNKIFRKKYFF